MSRSVNRSDSVPSAVSGPELASCTRRLQLFSDTGTLATDHASVDGLGALPTHVLWRDEAFDPQRFRQRRISDLPMRSSIRFRDRVYAAYNDLGGIPRECHGHGSHAIGVDVGTHLTPRCHIPDLDCFQTAGRHRGPPNIELSRDDGLFVQKPGSSLHVDAL